MEFDSYDQFDIEYACDNDRGGYDDSEDREIVEDHPSPAEVAAFWAEVRPETEIPF